MGEIPRHKRRPLYTPGQGRDTTSQEITTVYTRSRARYHVTGDNYWVHLAPARLHVTGDNHWVHIFNGEMPRHRRRPLCTPGQGRYITSQEITTCVHQVKGEIPHHKRQLLSTHPHGRDTTSQETTTEYTSPRARLHVTGDNHWVHIVKGEMPRHRRQPLSTPRQGRDTTSQ